MSLPPSLEKQEGLTQARLQELLTYDKESGLFYWRIPRKGKRAYGPAGSISNKGYRRIKLDYVEYKASRLVFLYVTGRWPSAYVDHINGERADDRWENLRDVSHAVNMANKHCLCAHYERDGLAKPWRARVWDGMKRVHLGMFATKEEAIVAAQQANASRLQTLLEKDNA